jgi:mono/diheme cytochrome c family protein
MFPPLVHNANVQSADATSVIRVILEGARTVPTDARPTPSSMPSFGWKLDDDEIAAVATYVRNSWGNAAAAVTADQVKSLRNELHAKTQ